MSAQRYGGVEAHCSVAELPLASHGDGVVSLDAMPLAAVDKKLNDDMPMQSFASFATEDGPQGSNGEGSGSLCCAIITLPRGSAGLEGSATQLSVPQASSEVCRVSSGETVSIVRAAPKPSERSSQGKARKARTVAKSAPSKQVVSRQGQMVPMKSAPTKGATPRNQSEVCDHLSSMAGTASALVPTPMRPAKSVERVAARGSKSPAVRQGKRTVHGAHGTSGASSQATTRVVASMTPVPSTSTKNGASRTAKKLEVSMPGAGSDDMATERSDVDRTSTRSPPRNVRFKANSSDGSGACAGGVGDSGDGSTKESEMRAESSVQTIKSTRKSSISAPPMRVNGMNSSEATVTKCSTGQAEESSPVSVLATGHEEVAHEPSVVEPAANVASERWRKAKAQAVPPAAGRSQPRGWWFLSRASNSAGSHRVGWPFAAPCPGTQSSSKLGAQPSVLSMSAGTRGMRLLRGVGLGKCAAGDVRELRQSFTNRKELLQGVKLNVALENFGKHWSSNNNSTQGRVSEEVVGIDDFLSHDWRTDGFSKFIALCFTFNSKPAAILSLVVAITMVAVQSNCHFLKVRAGIDIPTESVVKIIANKKYSIETGFLCGTMSPMVFHVVFFFWQTTKAKLFRRSTYAFLDKLCIDQEDDTKKLDGVLHLAAFLKASKRFVILWSPRYFTRLWCTYEVAFFLHCHTLELKERPQLLFQPVALARALYCVHVALMMILLASSLLGRYEMPLVEMGVFLGSILGTVVMIHRFRSLVQDLLDLPRQIDNFAVQDTDCFCCASQHLNPDTFQRMHCDRELVHSQLKAWYESEEAKRKTTFGSSVPLPPQIVGRNQVGSTSSLGEDYLDAFNLKVRFQFGQNVLASCGESYVTYSNALVVCLPFFWVQADYLIGIFAFDSLQVRIRWCGAIVMECFFIGPCLVRMLMIIVLEVEVKRPHTKGRFQNYCATLMTSMLYIFPCFILTVAEAVTVESESDVPMIAWAALVVLLTVCVFTRTTNIKAITAKTLRTGGRTLLTTAGRGQRTCQ